MDYSELEGKSVAVITDTGVLYGKVTGCDFDIGVTIQEKDNPSQYLICLNGPMSPYPKSIPKDERASVEEYKAMFSWVINGVKNGRLDISEGRGLFSPGNNPSAEKCAFAQ